MIQDKIIEKLDYYCGFINECIDNEFFSIIKYYNMVEYLIDMKNSDEKDISEYSKYLLESLNMIEKKKIKLERIEKIKRLNASKN